MAKQGCPNEGADSRLWGRLGCAIQAALSVKEGGPRYWYHDGKLFKLIVAYPPYVAGAVRCFGKWLLGRLGIRYDRFWPGYIFPVLTIKRRDVFVPF